MAVFLGIDTSNYTTSAALYNDAADDVIQRKKLLPVAGGALGLKQSDAVFSHIKQLPGILDELCKTADSQPAAVGFSARPRDEEGSYMPCFLVGECAAVAAASAAHLPAYGFSHQSGHIAAALYSVGRLDLLHERFIAFHVSGGTTEGLLVMPDKEQIFSVRRIGQSLDLKAGQAVDRVGAMLGLTFPAGMQLEELALQSTQAYRVTPTMKGGDCCLSGLENICKRMLDNGGKPCDIALYCIEYIMAALDRMTETALADYGGLPLLYAGGVMSNSLIQAYFRGKYGGMFAPPVFSSDNAAGIAVLAALRHTRRLTE